MGNRTDHSQAHSEPCPAEAQPSWNGTGDGWAGQTQKQPPSLGVDLEMANSKGEWGQSLR